MPHESLLWKRGSRGKILVVLKTQQELQHPGALTPKLPTEGGLQGGSGWGRRGRDEGKERRGENLTPSQCT